MSETKLPDYLAFATELQSAGLAVNPAELHGLLTGMLSGGLSLTDKSWQPMVFDYVSEGMGWPSKALQLAQATLDASIAELTGSGMAVTYTTLTLPTNQVTEVLVDSSLVKINS